MDTAVVAFATILGPVVAVLLTFVGQNRMQVAQNKLQEKLEAERREWEMKRIDSQGQYDDAWNVANRDRFDRAVKALEEIAKRMS